MGYGYAAVFSSQITRACITMYVCHTVQYSNQGYIPVYSVPCDPLHRGGTFFGGYAQSSWTTVVFSVQ